VLDDTGQWSQAIEQGAAVQEGQQLATGLQGTTITERFTVTHDLGYAWLPIAYEPSALEQTDDSVTWFARSQTMTVAEPPDQGATYTVQSVYPTPSVVDLEGTPVGSAVQYPDETKLPGAIPRKITDLAQQWTRNDTTVFDRVMSIQRHLTDLAVYHYDTTVSYAPTMQGLSDFLLTDKRGFCQQFASAMAVMLRSLHIPARVAMGYASGTQITNDTWSVMTTDLHAWVEVPFQGYGWLPFEPTPGKTNPAMATYMSSPSSGGNCEASTGKCSDGGGTKKQSGGRGGTTVKGREGAAGNFNNRPVSPGTPSSAPRKVPLREAVAWLAAHLASLPSALAVVTHDRWLMRLLERFLVFGDDGSVTEALERPYV